MIEIGRQLARTVSSALAVHLVVTAFENSPDAKVSFSARSTALGRLPQWRFFAPTPGIDNTHLFHRSSRDAAGDTWGPWTELSLVQPITWTALVWNPGTRGPKALFDCAQQLRTMGATGPTWESVTQSLAYTTLEHAVRVVTRDPTCRRAQFMVVASQDGDDESVMRPMLVSDPFDTEADRDP